jgi:hypothetical protein
MAFVAVVVAGGVLALRWPRVAWVHLPAALWGAMIALVGWICPLTPFENWLRVRGGTAAYDTGFLEHYLLPVLYPVAMTRGLQIGTGVFVVLVNALVYWRIFHARGAGHSRADEAAGVPTKSLAHGWQLRSGNSKEVKNVQDPHSR